MESVYIVNENGEVYPTAYKTYAAAQKAVIDKYKEELDRQIKEFPEYTDEILKDVNCLENPTGKTGLYIEKGICIEIHKLPISTRG